MFQKKKVVYVTCKKEIQKRKYVPYYCYYSKHAVITGDRAAYLSKLLFKIRVLRKTNAHFRLILKQLVLKQKISKNTYRKVDDIALRKKKELETSIVSKKVSIKKIEKEILKFKEIMKKLGYEEFKPKICRTIAGKRVCGLSEKTLKKSKKSKKSQRVFVVKKLFTKTYYFQKKPKIVGITKKNGYIVVKQKSKQWVRKEVKINQTLRSIVLNIAYAKLYKEIRIRNFVQKTIRKMKKSKKSKLIKF